MLYGFLILGSAACAVAIDSAATPAKSNFFMASITEAELP
jgi:hypothetical protein